MAGHNCWSNSLLAKLIKHTLLYIFHYIYINYALYKGSVNWESKTSKFIKDIAYSAVNTSILYATILDQYVKRIIWMLELHAFWTWRHFLSLFINTIQNVVPCSLYSSFYVISSSQNVFTRIQTEFNKEIQTTSIYFVLNHTKANIRQFFILKSSVLVNAFERSPTWMTYEGLSGTILNLSKQQTYGPLRGVTIMGFN